MLEGVGWELTKRPPSGQKKAAKLDSIAACWKKFVLATRLPKFANRFLAATAEVLELTLVTADQRLLGLGKIVTLANR